MSDEVRVKGYNRRARIPKPSEQTASEKRTLASIQYLRDKSREVESRVKRYESHMNTPLGVMEFEDLLVSERRRLAAIRKEELRQSNKMEALLDERAEREYVPGSQENLESLRHKQKRR